MCYFLVELDEKLVKEKKVLQFFPGLHGELLLGWAEKVGLTKCILVFDGHCLHNGKDVTYGHGLSKVFQCTRRTVHWEVFDL